MNRKTFKVAVIGMLAAAFIGGIFIVTNHVSADNKTSRRRYIGDGTGPWTLRHPAHGSVPYLALRWRLYPRKTHGEALTSYPSQWAAAVAYCVNGGQQLAMVGIPNVGDVINSPQCGIALVSGQTGLAHW